MKRQHTNINYHRTNINYHHLTLFLTLFLILLIPDVLATSKPISSTLQFPSGSIHSVPITVHAQATGTGTPQECITNPLVYTGEKGSFATNLDNLIIKSAPSLRCNGLWSIGDKIWYSYTLNNQEYSSPVDTIKSGTGLQVLIPMDVGPLVPNPSSPPGSSPGSSNENTNPSSPNPTTPPNADNNGKITASPDASTIELLLQSTPIDDIVKVTVFGRVTKGDLTTATIRIELRRMPDNKLVDYREVESSFPSTTEVNFDVSQIKSGLYQVQATALQNGVIIAASAPDTFTLRRPNEEIPAKSNLGGMAIALKNNTSSLLDSPYLALASYFISFFLILIALLLFMYKRRHYATPIPVEIIGETVEQSGKSEKTITKK